MKARLFLASFLLAAASQATPTVFYERIVRSFVDPLPGGQPGEAFFGMSSPSVSGFDVTFSASGTMGTIGIYCYCSGVLQKIAAIGDPAPREGEIFNLFETFPEVYERDVVFAAGTDSFSVGIYRWYQGMISVVADQQTLIPGGEPGETFPEVIITQPSIDENGVIFYGRGETTEGIYRQRVAGGELEIIADTQTEIPWVPGVDFTFFRKHPFSRNGTTVFRGGGPGWSGVTRDSGGDWVPAFSGNEPLPGGEPGETFVISPNSRISAGFESAVFPARGNMGSFGWYRERDASVEIGVDNDTINPLTGEPFESIVGTIAAGDGERLAFRAGFSLARTLFLREPDGTFLPIATEGEELEGELIVFVFIHRSSLSGSRVGFSVFSNARNAIYVATVGGGPSVVEIPTLTRSAVIALALLLSLAGAVLLRR